MIGDNAWLVAMLVLGGCGGGGAAWDEGTARAPATELSFPMECERSGRVYMFRVGPEGPVQIDELAERYRSELGMPVDVLPAVSPSPEGTAPRDAAEYGAQAQAATGLGGDTQAVLIGVTSEDLVLASSSVPFVFSARGPRMALVSTARLGDGDSAALYARLYKLVTQSLGALYCGFSESANPRSVLYRRVQTVEDLDRIDESIWR